LDRSGSMSGLESDTIGGFNSMIDKQRGEGDAIVSTILFNNEVKILHDRVDLDKVAKLTSEEYFVNGCTALLDAVGETIERIKRIQKKSTKKVPDTTLFVIVTDGQENSSREFTYKKVKGLIEKQKKNGWDFLFLGANIDVAAEAERIGIHRDNTVEYCCDAAGINEMYKEVGVRMKSAREKGSFSKE